MKVMEINTISNLNLIKNFEEVNTVLCRRITPTVDNDRPLIFDTYSISNI